MEYIIKETENEKITVRDLQNEVLTIMDELDRVCRKNKIKYALHAGSALGVVNYQGFIPWDDDIDVIVKKEDYPKLIKALQKDLKDDFYFQCYETDKRYNVLINSMKIRKKNTYIKETNTLLKNRCKSGDGIFVDVIWFGNAAEKTIQDQFYRNWIRFLMPITVLLDNLKIDFKPLKSHIVKWCGKYSDKYKDSKYCTQTICMPWEKFLKEPIFLKKDIFPFKEYDFEGRKYYSYNNIPAVVTKWYGPKCMKQEINGEMVDLYPEEKRIPKHTVDLNLKSDEPTVEDKRNIFIKSAVLISIILFIVSIFLLNETSLKLTGLGLVLLGMSLLILINRK